MAALPLMLAVRRAGAAPRRERLVVAVVGAGRPGRGHRHPAFFDVVQATARLRRCPKRPAGGDHGAVRRAAGRVGARRPDRRAFRPLAGDRRWRSARCCSPCRSLWVARRIVRSTPARRGAARGVGVRGASGAGTTVADVSAGVAARVAGAWRGGAGAAGAAAARPAGRHGVRGARRWRWWRSTCSRRAWATTRRSRRATRSSPRRRRSATCRTQRPARFAGLEPRRRSRSRCRSRRTWRCATGIYDARGYDYPVEERYAELWRRVIATSPDCNYAFCPESAGAHAASTAGALACSA